MKQPHKKSTGNPGVRRKSARRKGPTAGSVLPPGSSKSKSLLSLSSIGQLRDRTKQWLQYLQQADRMLDTLYVAGNSLSESGVLQKLVQNKGKNLSTGDLTSILTALINTPIADQFIKGWGGGSSESEAKADSSQQPKQQVPGTLPQQALPFHPSTNAPPGAFGQPYQNQPYQNQPFPHQPQPPRQQFQSPQQQFQPQYQPYQQFSQHGFPQGMQPQAYQPHQPHQSAPAAYLPAPSAFQSYLSHPVYSATNLGTKKKTAK